MPDRQLAPPPDGVPRSPTGRTPQWVLRELSGTPVEVVPWRGAPPSAPAPRRRLRRILTVGVAAVAATSLLALAPDDVGAGPPGLRGDGPTPQRAGPARLAPAVAPAVGSSSHAYEATGPNGRPVTYDPCRPIRYVVRPDGAPPGGSAVLAQAIARTAAATGLQFIDDGTTDEAPTSDRHPYQPARYGDRWAPVLITWSDPQESPLLAVDVVGVGGSASVAPHPGGQPTYVTGAVTLDGPALTALATSPGGQGAVRAVIAHELGHLVGLDHVQDRTQLTYPRAQPGVTDFAAGDLTGLARLGAGPCVLLL